MAQNPPIAIIACAVLHDAIRSMLDDPRTRLIAMEYGLHLAPKKMRAAIQEQIDGLAVPHVVLIGFGLCGNGLVGLKSRSHTLVIPRVDDCVALFFGSRAAYLREFDAEPGTYYLTPGWLECGGEPLSEYHKCLEKYGAGKAALISDSLYGHYRKSCFIALSAAELERYGAQARQVADFCKKRWDWEYKEFIGSTALIRGLLGFGRSLKPMDEIRDTEDYVIIRPGEEVRQEPFMRPAVLEEE
jgi:hypothetical protein